MELAKLTSKGQITIPKEIRDKLKLKTGDKVIFIYEGEKIIFANSSLIALKKIQNSMKGKAVSAGIKNGKDLDDVVQEVRKEIWEKRYADND
jgi:antitoxin PrlF